MNDQLLQQLLLRAEVPPPPGGWNAVAEELDVQKTLLPFSSALNALEITAPEKVWNEISGSATTDALQEWKNPLQHLNVTPPTNDWGTIETRLNDQSLQQKLEDLKIPAPSAAWKNIEEHLESKPSANVLPLHNRKRLMLQLAAAAVITGVVLMGGYWMLRQTQPGDTNVVLQAPPVQKQPQKINESTVRTAAEPAAEVPAKSKAVVSRKKVTAPGTVASDNVTDHIVTLSPSAATVMHAHQIRKKPVSINNSGFQENKYLVVIDSKGELVRVTRKLIQMKCLEGNPQELETELTAALQSRNCDNQIKKWQEKIAQSAALSSGGFPIDIHEVIQTTER